MAPHGVSAVRFAVGLSLGMLRLYDSLTPWCNGAYNLWIVMWRARKGEGGGGDDVAVDGLLTDDDDDDNGRWCSVLIKVR